MEGYDNFTLNPGMKTKHGDSLHVENAYIEEVYAENKRNGYVIISYDRYDQNNMIYQDLLRLNIGRRTIIANQSGAYLSLSDLKTGMRIDADFSAAMTRSIPPQSTAYRIIVHEEANVNITTDRVVAVDMNNGFITTGNPYDMYDQMIFTVSDSTILLDQNKNQITLEAITPGQLIRVEHANFQTMSIPPQSPAYLVEVL